MVAGEEEMSDEERIAAAFPWENHLPAAHADAAFPYLTNGQMESR
jgi:hypothetical protein